MQTSSFSIHSLSLQTRPLSTAGFYGRNKTKTYSTINVVAADQRDSYDKDYNGKLVDENMIVLRIRIRDMKVAENMKKSYEPPSEWTDWERKYFMNYHYDVLEGIGFLQSILMETRPCLALGIVALLALSVPMSMALLVFYLMGIYS